MLGLEHQIELYGEGGLAWCKVCCCGEGSLLTYCPGFKLNSGAEQAVYTGNVIDLAVQIEHRKAKP